jgi:four helix bundle protein
VWRKAHELVLAVYSFRGVFPKEETYGLALQMRRAAASVPANIAKGFRRRGKADKAHYMSMAEASWRKILDTVTPAVPQLHSRKSAAYWNEYTKAVLVSHS